MHGGDPTTQNGLVMSVVVLTGIVGCTWRGVSAHKNKKRDLEIERTERE